jgi:hypothetical protein
MKDDTKPPAFAEYIKKGWGLNPLKDAKTFGYLLDASEIADQITNQYGLTAADKKALTAALTFAFLAGHNLSDSINKELSDCKGAIAEIRTQRARRAKDPNTHTINRVVANCALEHWRERPAHRRNVSATVHGIQQDVATRLKKEGIRGISDEAIRQRLIKLRRS